MEGSRSTGNGSKGGDRAETGGSGDTSQRWTTNPLITLGFGLVAGTVLTAVAVQVPPTVAAVQSTLPLAVGIGLVAYGSQAAGDDVTRFRGTVLRWTGYGVAAFFAVGFWFGQVSRLFETSLALAVVASLCVGAAFGGATGVYAARFRASNAALAARSEELERFANVVSHDLRNPLNVARGQVKLAAAEAEGTDDGLAAAARALDRMESLIDDLLTLAREGEAVGETNPVDLGDCAEAAWESVPTTDAALNVDATETIDADPDRLRQLLENLFRNAVEHGSTSPRSNPHQDAVEHGSTSPRSNPHQDAVEHSPTSPRSNPHQDAVEHGSMEPTATNGSATSAASADNPSVTITVEDGSGWFAVADDGEGFPRELQGRAFDAGVSTGSEGIGLGLSIVGRIVDGHGWTVAMEESDGGGARIVVRGVEAADDSSSPVGLVAEGTTDT